MADELAQQELNDQRMLGEVASRINVLKEMEAKARARLDANKKELSLLGQRVHSMCSELPNTLHAVLDNLQKIAETPGSLSEADRAVFAELQHKIDKFIEDISNAPSAEQDSDAAVVSSLRDLHLDSSATTSIPSDSEHAASTASSVASGYQTAASRKLALRANLENAVASDEAEVTPLDSW
uniref:GRIP domain-containing protein n=1 Tax=Steinernema glaseri TaxID=37863 RepID=A0A1I8A7C9_9BILA